MTITDPLEYFSTADACALAGVGWKTLKNYEEQGLLGPVKRDSRGCRLYTRADIAQARRIYAARVARHGRTGLRRITGPLETTNKG